MNTNNRLTDHETAAVAARHSEVAVLTAQLQHLTAASLDPQHVMDMHYLVLPPGYQRQDITADVEKARDEPYRKRGQVVMLDVSSLIQHAIDQGCEPTGYIYANPDTREIVAVYNDHKNGDHPGWRDHRASFKAEYTPEFELWLHHNGHECAMVQVQFAEFLEENIADIAEGGSDLLTMATTLQAKTEIDFKSARRLDNGQNQLTYVENISATAGANGAMVIPPRFDLAVRIFKNGARYKIGARLKYRLRDGHVKFWYELERPLIAIEDAFAGYVDTVREKSGYTVLIGKP